MKAPAVARASGESKDKNRFYALDAFRGLAAVGVAIFHFRWTHLELSSSPVFDRLFNLLDFFFVLSGFVLAHVYLSKPLALGDFAWRRLARLYPLHVFALFMFLLLQLGKLLAVHLGYAARNDAFQGMNVLNFFDTLFLLQGTGLLGHEISWNYPSWTVSTELASAIIIYAIAVRFGRRALVPICAGIVVAAATYMYVFTIDPTDYGPNALIRTVYGLAMGCLLYYIHARYRLVRGPVWGTIAEVVALAAVYMIIASGATRPVWYLVTFGLAAVIYVFAAEQGLISRMCRRLQLHRLGTGSYSIYLNHALIGTVFSKLYLAVAPKLGIAGVMSVLVYVPMFILVLVAYSRLTLVYIERPGQDLWLWAGRYLSERRRTREQAPLALAARRQQRLAHVLSRRPAASSGVMVPDRTASAS